MALAAEVTNQSKNDRTVCGQWYEEKDEKHLALSHTLETQGTRKNTDSTGEIWNKDISK